MIKMLQSTLNSNTLKYITHIEVISSKYFWFYKVYLSAGIVSLFHTCEHWFKKCMDSDGCP